LTVSAVVENDGKFLMIEERSSGLRVINQPGGHIEAGESPEQAAEREAAEETGCEISVTGLLGVYLWIHPQTRQNFLRIVYVADLLASDAKRKLDAGIYAVHWYTVADVRHRIGDLRSPIVLRSIEDYMAGQRKPTTLLRNMLPLQQNVGEVMANAVLV
jgi:8-oxo-dGTP pyrophosphatase MutT (NUDIX family)